VDHITPSTPPQLTGSDARPVYHPVITDNSNHTVDKGGLEALVAASQGPGPLDNGPPMPQVRRADQPRMRSSIACARCRRSKVKCLNNGVNTQCRACVVSGRECIYPPPASSDRSHRRDGSLGRVSDQLLGTPDVRGNATKFVSGYAKLLQGPRSARAKPKKSQSFFGNHTSTRAPVDALNTSVVTPQVWLELVSSSLSQSFNST
jgi:hypothetical protein